MELPQKVANSVLGTVLTHTAKLHPELAITFAEIARENVEEQFLEARAFPTLVYFYWKAACRYLDSNVDNDHHFIIARTPRETSHASFSMRNDAHMVWRQGASRESPNLLRVSSALSTLADATLLVASGGRLKDPNLVKTLQVLTQTLPENHYELQRALPSWNSLAERVEELGNFQKEILYPFG